MPYIHLEYTNNIQELIDFQSLFKDIHLLAKKIADVNVANCKSKAQSLECYYMGMGAKENAFAHLNFYFLEGRNSEVKKTLGKGLLDLLKHYYRKSIEDLNLQLTVHVEDLKRDFYFKYSE